VLIPTSLLSNPKFQELSHLETTVLWLLMIRAKDNICFPSYTQIAKDCKVRRENVIKAVKKLISIGFIDKQPVFKKANNYCIKIDTGNILPSVKEAPTPQIQQTEVVLNSVVGGVKEAPLTDNITDNIKKDVLPGLAPSSVILRFQDIIEIMNSSNLFNLEEIKEIKEVPLKVNPNLWNDDYVRLRRWELSVKYRKRFEKELFIKWPDFWDSVRKERLEE